MEKLEITIEEITSSMEVKPYLFKKGWIEKWTQYKLTYLPPVLCLSEDNRELLQRWLQSETSSNIRERLEENRSDEKMSQLQKLLRKAFYSLPSRNPERKPVDIIIKVNMDENSKAFLGYLVEEYQKAQDAEVRIIETNIRNHTTAEVIPS